TIVQWLKEVADADRVRDGVGDRSAAVFEGGDTAFEARRIVDGMLECRKPIISVVTGPSAGLGGTFLLLADVVVAGRSAVCGAPHVRRGLGAGDGAQVIWPLLVGVTRAKYYLMTGDTIDAEEAERLGLVNFLVDDADALPRAREIADRLARGPIHAIMASK